MTGRSATPWVREIIDAIERIRAGTEGMTLAAFAADGRKRRLVERGIAIISAAGRRRPAALRARHQEIPWPNVAGIGNVPRHEYPDAAPAVLWRVARDNPPAPDAACREEMARDRGRSFLWPGAAGKRG